VGSYSGGVHNDNNIDDQTSGAPATRHKLQPLPEGLAWPRPRLPGVPDVDRNDDDYDRAPECGRPGGLERYLRRVWEPLIPHVDMPTLREHWPRLGEAIDRQRRKLPPDLLPSKNADRVDREVAGIPRKGDRPVRLDRTLKMRAYRARRKSRELSP
jgi:hypothetical protein